MGTGPSNTSSGAIDKYGWDNIDHVVLCSVSSKENADFLERWFIKKYDTTSSDRGYNCSKGGAGPLGVTWSEEHKKEHSRKISGAGNGMYGRHHTEESRKRMSEKLSGRKLTPEMREFRTDILLEANKRRQIPIRQLDLDGNLIATYPGMGEMTRITGYNHSSVWKVCRGQSNQAYGYLWEYEDETLRVEAKACAEDRAKLKAENIKNRGTGGGMSVIQFDIDGNEIARYPSLCAAERETGLHRDRIGDCCHGGLETYGGFVWKFENEGQNGAEKSAVIQFDLDGNEIARFDSMAEASAKTGVPRYQIRHCCSGRQKTARGFGWQYADVDHIKKICKPNLAVIQFDLDGNEVGRFKSLAEAQRATGHDHHRISECCKGERQSYRDTIWRYAETL